MHWLRELERTVFIWPSIEERLQDLSKLPTLTDLKHIAETNGLPIPKLDSWPPRQLSMQTVIAKRTHSFGGMHVRYPAHNVPASDPEGLWFSQQFIPTLQDGGELRAFVLGGEMVYVVHSKILGGGSLEHGVSDSWSIDVMDKLPPLASQPR